MRIDIVEWECDICKEQHPDRDSFVNEDLGEPLESLHIDDVCKTCIAKINTFIKGLIKKGKK